MITTNVLQRTFQIKYGGGAGTAFTIDIDKRQYLVTAEHVVHGYKDGAIEIFHEGRWKALACKPVGMGKYDPAANNAEPDVAVLAPEIQISPTFELEATAGGMILGQTVYFLGFPYGKRQDVQKELNRDFPLPLVKGGVLSSVTKDGDKRIILIDGHNNPGFSGGPVVFTANGMPPSPKNPLKACGIISAYPTYREEVYGADGKPIGYLRNNPGIVVAYQIDYATDFIKANPIGAKIV